MSRRYEPLVKIASGGTASVYVGTASGALGFRQLVAIKRPHEHLAEDPAFRAALIEEAKIAARLRHANVVDVRDVEVDERGVQLVMDYVEGASLSELIRSWGKELPARAAAVALRVVLDACEGLRAVHELTSDEGQPLGLVHRDISPANVLVGLDGVARIADFGLAKPLLAVERTTTQGSLRGKLGYMAPEYIRGKGIDARIDVFAMGIVAWEVLARRRLFRGANDGETLDRVQTMQAPPLAEVRPELGAAAAPLDEVVGRAVAKDPEARFTTVADFAAALEAVARAHDLSAGHGEVRASFGSALRAELDERRRKVAAAEAGGADVVTGSVRTSVASSSMPGASPGTGSVPPPSVDVTVEPSVLTRAASPAALGRASEAPPAARRRSLGVVAAVALLIVLASVLVGGRAVLGARGSGAPGAGSGAGAAAASGPPSGGPREAHEAASDLQPRADELRGQAPRASSSTTPTGRPPGKPREPAAPAGATSAAGGGKPPRPNPYAPPPGR